MSPGKLERNRQKIEVLRKRGEIKPSDVERIAKSLGRVLARRGKEPTWINPKVPDLRPISIPHHGMLNRFTANSILDALEDDIDKLGHK